jgi:tetratricopeptide (TPR) repeat protein
MNLGLVQRLAGDYLDAEATFRRVIELIEGSGRITSPRLARAHAGLALTYYAARRYDLAVSGFERAIALNRRAEGLFNDDQLPLLDKQADALTEVGRVQDALQAHRYALRLVERRHGAKSLRYASELVALGRWYTRVRAYESARYTIRRAVDLVVELQGPQSLELIGR